MSWKYVEGSTKTGNDIIEFFNIITLTEDQPILDSNNVYSFTLSLRSI